MFHLLRNLKISVNIISRHKNVCTNILNASTLNNIHKYITYHIYLVSINIYMYIIICHIHLVKTLFHERYIPFTKCIFEVKMSMMMAYTYNMDNNSYTFHEMEIRIIYFTKWKEIKRFYVILGGFIYFIKVNTTIYLYAITISSIMLWTSLWYHIMDILWYYANYFTFLLCTRFLCLYYTTL